MKLLIVVAVAAMLLSAVDARMTYGLVPNAPEWKKCLKCLLKHCSECYEPCKEDWKSIECLGCVAVHCLRCVPKCLKKELVEVIDHN